MTTNQIQWHESTPMKGVWIVERNTVLQRLNRLRPDQSALLLTDEKFAAGLDALDPFSPVFVKDRKVRQVILFGLSTMIAQEITK